MKQVYGQIAGQLVNIDRQMDIPTLYISALFGIHRDSIITRSSEYAGKNKL